MRHWGQLYLLIFVFSLFPVSALAHDHDPPRIMAAEVMKRLNAGEEIVFLDTRTEAARSASKLLISKSIPIKNTDSINQVIRDVPKDRLVVPYCT